MNESDNTIEETKAKHAGGRPSDYIQELADKICNELAQGISLRTVCKADDMPSGVAIFRWLRTYPEFRKQYEDAKQESTDAMAEDVLDIADDGTNDYVLDNYDKGKTPGYQLNGENIQRSRLRVDTRKWLMSKMKPKKYGEKLDMTSDGKAISQIVGVNVIKDAN